MFDWIGSLFHKLHDIFAGDKARAAFDRVLSISQLALPIVKEIAAITPNRTDDEIVAAYEKYGVPLLKGSPADLLRWLVAHVLRQQGEDAPNNEVNAGIELAVVAHKNGE